MKKYLAIAKLTWDEMSAYRFNFVMWRIRLVLQLLTAYFLWSAIIPKNNEIFGYTQSLMLTYILGISFISSIVTSSKTIAVGDEIIQGNLSNLLIRPVNYFLFWLARDIGDKAMNISFSIIELILLFLILKPPVLLQTDPFYFLFTLLSLFIAVILFFFFNFLLGFIGFWSLEVWAPRFIFFIILSFFAGGFFPIDILPKQFVNIFQFLPFQYLLYFPMKIYLGQLGAFDVYKGLFISFLWVFILYFLVRVIWQMGLKEYTAHGR